MDDQLKEKLTNALNNGKAAAGSIEEIVKNITKEVMEKSKTQGEDLKVSSKELFHEIMKNMEKVGKNSVEFMKAASSGFMEGLKVSQTGEKNLVKDAADAIGESVKSLAGAGLYVTKDTVANVKSAFDHIFNKIDPKQ